MTELMSLLGGAVFYAAVFFAQFLLVLVFRNPLRSERLKSSGSAVLPGIAITSLIGISLGVLVNEAVNTGLYVPAALAGSAAYALITPIVLWRLMGMRARIAACQRGQSPFSSLGGSAGGPVGKGAMGSA